MASATITVRTTKTGEKRHVARFRLGGRSYPVQHGGSFTTMREARVRRDLIAGELAAGRNPRSSSASSPSSRRRERSRMSSTSSSRPGSTSPRRRPRTTRRTGVGSWISSASAIPGRSAGRTCRRRSPFSPTTSLARLAASLPVHAAAGARLRGARPEPGPRPAREASPPRRQGRRAAERGDGGRDHRERAATVAARHPHAGADGDASVGAPRSRVGRRRRGRLPLPHPRREDPRSAAVGCSARVGDGRGPRYCHRYASVKFAEGVPVTDLAAQFGHTRKSLTLDTYSHVLLGD